MTPATNPANYRTVTRNHKPCLVCVDCGRESMPGSRSHRRLGRPAPCLRAIVEQATPVSDDRIFAAYERGLISMSEAMNRDF